MNTDERTWVPLRPHLIVEKDGLSEFVNQRAHQSALGPMVHDGLMANLVPDNAEWMRLEGALGRKLDEAQRQNWCAIVRSFLYSVCLKKELPSPRRYRTRLTDRLQEIRQTADNLFAMLLAAGPAANSSEPISEKQAEKYVGQGKAALKSAETASIVTAAISHVLAAEDHVRIQLQLFNPQMDKYIVDLSGTIDALEQEIADVPTNQAGADGQYELLPLLEDLLLVAISAGSDVKITSHEFRAKDSVEQVTPVVAFVVATMKILKENGSELIEASGLPSTYKADAERLLNKLLDKNEGSLLEPLEQARSRIKGSDQKNRPENPSDL